MLLTKLSLAENNLIIPGQKQKIVKTIIIYTESAYFFLLEAFKKYSSRDTPLYSLFSIYVWPSFSQYAIYISFEVCIQHNS
jgi:hypothetical protein